MGPHFPLLFHPFFVLIFDHMPANYSLVKTAKQMPLSKFLCLWLALWLASVLIWKVFVISDITFIPKPCKEFACLDCHAIFFLSLSYAQ